MALHTFKGGCDGRQPGDGPSLVPSRSSPFSLWVTEVPMDHQDCDGPSPVPLNKQRPKNFKLLNIFPR
ncbi:hypothetical protein HAX54_049599, partial [Datura stramonium]|nr:hypothetical protein [Datura stramonium]